MMFHLIQTQHGYTLINGSDKYVMNRSKQNVPGVEFYLKKVEPITEYITGLFAIDNKPNEYRGKTACNQQVKVIIDTISNIANIYIK